MSPAASPIRCARIDLFGKVPWRDEYVRPPAPTPVLAAFDHWVAEGVDAATRSPGAWGPGYAMGAVHAFLFRRAGASASSAGDDEVLAGAIGPSADGAGRQYPVAIAASLSLPVELASAPELLPLVLEELWQGASELVALAATSPVPIDDERIRLLPMAAGLAFEEARSVYGQWTGSLRASDLWASLLAGTAVAVPERMIEAVVAAVRPFRGVERPRTQLTLRAPLGTVAGAAVCFWIDVARRAAGWPATIPSFFWSHDGNTGAMLLHLGEAPRSTLAELWGTPRERDEVFDLAAAAARGPLPVDQEVASRARGPHELLCDLLASID